MHQGLDATTVRPSGRYCTTSEQPVADRKGRRFSLTLPAWRVPQKAIALEVKIVLVGVGPSFAGFPRV